MAKRAVERLVDAPHPKRAPGHRRERFCWLGGSGSMPHVVLGGRATPPAMEKQQKTRSDERVARGNNKETTGEARDKMREGRDERREEGDDLREVKREARGKINDDR